MVRLHRLAAVLAAGALVVTTTAGAAQAAAADRSATWLTRQLTGGLVHNDQYDFDDYGLTADVALALNAIGGNADTVTSARDALAAHVDSWTTGVDFGSDDIYAGSVAKAVVTAEVTGGDPRAFGGVDLVRRLEFRVSSTRPTVGRIHDKSATDYANSIGQAFAARGLAVAGSDRAPAAIRYLLKQQCSPGYFRLNFPGGKNFDKQTCDSGNRSTISAPDTDVTALAVINLRAVPHKSAEVRAALHDALGWLKRHQRADGSFGGGTSTRAPNANSTGLAAWALGLSGACTPAVKAAVWVKKLEVPSGQTDGFQGQSGAIAYDRTAYDKARTNGITADTQDQWRRATSQAAPGLDYLTCG